MAEALAKEMRKLCSVQAPTRITRRGRVVATTRATPHAPPRRVSGKLLRSITVIRTANGASVQVYAPYAVYLEKGTNHPHPFVSVALKNLGLTGRNS